MLAPATRRRGSGVWEPALLAASGWRWKACRPVPQGQALRRSPLQPSLGRCSIPDYVSHLVAGFWTPDLHLRLQVVDFVDAGVEWANKNRAKQLL